MNIKRKRVLIYGTERLKKDFIYLFPKAKIYGEIEDINTKNSNGYTLDNIDKKSLKGKIIVICKRKEFELIEKLYNKGLKENKHYIFFEDLGYLFNDKIDEFTYKVLKFLFSKFRNREFREYIPNSFYLKKMIYTDSIENFECDYPFKYMQIQLNTFVFPCCEGWTEKELGSILIKKLKSIWTSKTATLFRLSIINRTYIFCNPNTCPFLTKETKKTDKRYEKETPKIPEEINVSIDSSCNLKCKSCRKNQTNITGGPRYLMLKYLSNKILKSPYVVGSKEIIMASQGEVFFSKTYRRMLFNSNLTKRDSITIHTNGTLLTKKNLDRLTSIYKNINVLISVDAAKEETYKKIRIGGNFKALTKNLNNLSIAKKEGKINKVTLLYVVQKDNYKEMVEFIKKTKELGFDKINFSKIENWDTYTEKEFRKVSMFDINDNPKKELLKVLENPIFDDEIVDKKTNILKIRK